MKRKSPSTVELPGNVCALLAHDLWTTGAPVHQFRAGSGERRGAIGPGVDSEELGPAIGVTGMLLLRAENEAGPGHCISPLGAGNIPAVPGAHKNRASCANLGRNANANSKSRYQEFR